MRRRIVLLSLLVVACSKKESAQPPPTGSGSAAVATPTASGSAAVPAGSAVGTASGSASAGKSKFDYASKRPGPHAGFDLAAIHAKLQGHWLVGGSAFSSIPTVWSLEGDSLTQIGEDGKRSSTTLRLLAPCYFVDGAADGNSGTYSHFAFDGDTLYLGLGNAGIVQGDKTIGCMAVAMYVFEGGKCTRWTKESFSTPEREWKEEPGECGYSDDRKQFRGDDTNSSRKIYGVETLNVKGNVLLTTQMEGNKAERFPSLDAALAKQREKIDAKIALTKTPTDLPFASWGLESKDPALAANAPVWAAAADRKGAWNLGRWRFKSFGDGAVWVTAGDDAWAPSTFVHTVDATPPAANAPALLAIGALMPYGRFVKLDNGKAIVRFKSGNKIDERAIDADRVLAIKPKAWVFGAPVARKSGEVWKTGTLVLDAGADVYVDADRKVEKLAKTDVRLVDLGRRWAKGAKVWAAPPDGFSLSFVEGRIEKVHDDGIFYTVKTPDRVFDQTFDKIIDKL